MAKGNEILITSEPKGTRMEGPITDTSKPGTVMEIVPGTKPIGGRHSWRASTGADGTPRLIAVLLPDHTQGKLATDAYVAGTRCFLYCPVPGEELNMLVDIPGTGTVGSPSPESIGEQLMVRNNGHLTPWVNTKPCMGFQAMEAVPGDPTTGVVLTWCIFTG